ncbi:MULTISPECIES: dinucleotide-utilizing enzyme, molybdopterin/thiamine biosynthesis family 1 [Campylobacter]|uniref:Dinucleotide-utilizing enzyme, molybdopterin/thiamine biosynthesis family 1 n=1 Tax=Campylobacter subantarcticus LMG 24374 TaxID=1388751 RepID=A0A0A8HBM6_9BACT|nr:MULTISPECIES: dinucleotide-utilizing enzyme, molybdopterin/thiamine biosynthesis family 1 [Campylobacter]AJC91387.1 dinucleotide-utilizing enzyme, molybdopterin/thiamine biosynthesis family 1 [Campylobacter subantarcticus LMG 24374]EAJ1261019.1 dinucleotide-utilizing enzyme, molybdopterin/thiamine biosynthesis family 1 [Campylobacter lari]EAJ1262069.1 dinucleotide-utilizing enzyme, molybdopterin/thiamine biosynthesis family 1 [Campylobacter lari]QOR01018.1 dinucleotide-utilizing enzyme, moly
MDRYTRIKWLINEENFAQIQNTKVLVCGLGGVGGICTDALFRSGFSDLTLIDADRFETTNQNRQLHSENIGEEKAKVFERIYNAKGIVSKIDNEFLQSFNLSEFDLIIDAIDDIPAKVALANLVDLKKQIFISSTGGARKLDPTRIKTTSIFKTHGDALAKKFRYELRKSGFKGDFDVVFSDEEAHCKELGSFMGVTASFGLALASLALRKVLNKKA